MAPARAALLAVLAAAVGSAARLAAQAPADDGGAAVSVLPPRPRPLPPLPFNYAAAGFTQAAGQAPPPAGDGQSAWLAAPPGADAPPAAPARAPYRPGQVIGGAMQRVQQAVT